MNRDPSIDNNKKETFDSAPGQQKRWHAKANTNTASGTYNWRDRNTARHDKAKPAHNWNNTADKSKKANFRTNDHKKEEETIRKNEVIIYYNDPTITDHVVKQLVEKVAKEGGRNKENKHTDQDKCKASKLVPSSGLNSQQTTATNGHNNTSGEPVTIFYGASGLATSQVEQEKKEEMIIKEPIEPKLVEFKPSSSSDPNDVITGGAPISPPSLPASNQDGELLRLRCTLVSHPGHFYIRFHNEKHDKLLASLDEFYNNDELIELTVDVLRPGQYYGACRIRPGRREWVRAQLLHVESAEMINCLLIDEGCFGVFRLADLQPLYSSFRTAPKQAIRAEIKGIKPPESATDWLPKQAVEFKSLVSDRPLFTRLDDDHHTLVESGHRLRLDLMFGEDDQDETLRGRSVASLLIERGLAQKEESV